MGQTGPEVGGGTTPRTGGHPEAAPGGSQAPTPGGGVSGGRRGGGSGSTGVGKQVWSPPNNGDAAAAASGRDDAPARGCPAIKLASRPISYGGSPRSIARLACSGLSSQHV